MASEPRHQPLGVIHDVIPATADDRPAVSTQRRVSERVPAASRGCVVIRAVHLDDETFRQPVAVDFEPVVPGVNKSVDAWCWETAIDTEVKEPCLCLSASAQYLRVELIQGSSKPGDSASTAMACQKQAQ